MYISISVSNITSNGHHYNRHLKLIVDNFFELHGTWTSTTLVRKQECPARPMREGELQDGSRNGRLLGVWEFACQLHPGPGILKQDSSSTENGRLLGVWEFELDRLKGSRAGRPVDRKVIHRLLTVIGEFGSLRA